MTDVPIGRLFPAGGPADPDVMIGREADVDEIATMLREGVHVLLAGDRRIGKTTVCKATCEVLRTADGFRVVHVEVPERTTSVDLCQLIVDRCASVGLERVGGKLFGAARPLIEELLKERGIPLDLSALGPDPVPLTRRRVLELPAALAERAGRLVFFLDELQRVADYEDGDELLHDLTDLYAGQVGAVVLVDGSSARTFERLVGTPDGLGKLVHRRDLAPTIALRTWREGLAERFRQVGHPIEDDALERLLEFGDGRPYPTMTAARHSALTARATGGPTDMFCVGDGIAAAEKQLDDDPR